MKDKTLNDISIEVHKARAKFPGNDLLIVALMEEVGELAQAMLDKTPEEIRKEAIQVACVAIRIIEEGDFSVNAYRAARYLKPVVS